MRYATAAAFRQALDDRLKTEAAHTGLPLARLRKQIAFELFLRRLAAAAPNRWVLKGALALELRLKTTTRPTNDIDLGRADDEQAAITLDIGFTESIPAMPDMIKTSDLLAFAGINPIDLPNSPAVAAPRREGARLHTHLRRHRTAEHPTKGSGRHPPDRSLRTDRCSSIENRARGHFYERQRHELPSSLPAPPSEWAAPYRRLAAGIGVEPDLSAAFAEAATFLDPILGGHPDGTWDAAQKRWT